MRPIEHRDTFAQLLLDVGVLAKLAARADVADVIRKRAVGAQELVGHFQIFAKQRVPGDQLVVARSSAASRPALALSSAFALVSAMRSPRARPVRYPPIAAIASARAVWIRSMSVKPVMSSTSRTGSW